ncbi:MAG: hypothetical protein DI570_09170, partial [Phenylobacterium zucineum]
MPQQSGTNNSFSSGEISEEAWERSDLEQVATGCEAAWNFLGAPAGAAVSRGGFWRRGAPKNNGFYRRLFPWKRADGDGLVLELGHLYGRVWTAGGARVMDPLNPSQPYEFSHGYTESDIPHLRIKQVGDVGYVTHRFGVRNGLFTRYEDNAWSSTILVNRNGP